ncbi:MAG: hypothetical protein ABI839_05285 [Verrucomicrobiota bacterium]
MNLGRLVASGAAVFALAAATGCTTFSNAEIVAAAKSGRLYAVNTRSAPFYRYGPQQSNGPDERLPHDTLVALIQPSFGYCKVHLLTGDEGYVASENLHPAPPALVAAATAPPPSAMIAQARTHRFHLNSSDPRLIAPPEPLPLDLPEPTPIPSTQNSPGPTNPAP